MTPQATKADRRTARAAKGLRRSHEVSDRAPLSEIDVRAILKCPNASPLTTEDSVVAIDALPPRQLEHAIERRASVGSERDGRRCLYVPLLLSHA